MSKPLFSAKQNSIKKPASNRQTVTCLCGYSKGHFCINPIIDYSTMGWFMLLTFAYSALPTKVVWKCGQCSAVVDVVTDPTELKRYRYRTPTD